MYIYLCVCVCVCVFLWPLCTAKENRKFSSWNITVRAKASTDMGKNWIIQCK